MPTMHAPSPIQPAHRPVLIDADSDGHAVLTWLAEHTASPRTLSSYRKEVERFLLWLSTRNKTLAQVRRDDVQDYQRHLAQPWPAAQWIGPARPRSHPDWRPFSAPLSPASVRHALTVLGALYTYLNHAGYLGGNPFALLRQRRQRTAPPFERFLDGAAWRAVLDTLDALPRHSTRDRAHADRARWLMALIYLTGARRSEVAQARMGDVLERRGLWWWRIHGKGGVVADVPVGDALLEELARYRASLGLPVWPAADEETPLVCRVTGDDARRAQPLSDKAIYLVCKEVFARAAADCADAATRRQLEAASTHWLRHTAASHQLDAGVPLLMVSQNLRHASIQTTRRYLHSEADARHAASAAHTLGPSAKEKGGG